VVIIVTLLIWLTLVSAVWVVVITHPVLPTHYRRIIQLVGLFAVQSSGLVLLIWLTRVILGVGPALVSAGVLMLLWQFDLVKLLRTVSALADKASEPSRRDGLDGLEIGDCLAHVELEFYIRNRGPKSKKPTGSYVRDLLRMDLHLGRCNTCRNLLKRDEEALRKRGDLEG